MNLFETILFRNIYLLIPANKRLMNRKEHVQIGLIAFIVYSIPLYMINNGIPNGFVLGLLVVIIGSIMPDILEPARSYTHRGKYHSRDMLSKVGFICIVFGVFSLISLYYEPLSPLYTISGFFVGYVSHLLADSMTPMGLPDY